MSNKPRRQIIKKGFALWTNLPNDVVWFEAGKSWTNELIKGNWWERKARMLVLSYVSPGYAIAMHFVLEFYRSKLKKRVGPKVIWIAKKIASPEGPAHTPPPRVCAKKRTKKNRMKTLVPWVPKKWNIF